MDRVWLTATLALMAPLAALVVLVGMLSTGLAPLAVFGPLYAISLALTRNVEDARAGATRATVAASLGIPLALAPVLLLLADGATPIPASLTTAGVLLLAVGLGAMAGLAAAPAPRRLEEHEARRWTVVAALDREQATGLIRLLIVLLPAGILVGLLREAPILLGDEGAMITVVEAAFGELVHSGSVVLPGPSAAWLVAIPLTLSPVAIGFLVPPRQAGPLALGGLAFLVLSPLAFVFDLPVETPDGVHVPIGQLAEPALSLPIALAPIGAGALLGGGLLYLARRMRRTPILTTTAWAAAGALIAWTTHGLLPAAGTALGILLASLLLSLHTGRAPVGAAVALGAAAAWLLAWFAPRPDALALGALATVTAVGALAVTQAARSLPLPFEAVRSPRTLIQLVLTTIVASALAWLLATSVAGQAAPLAAPHARSLTAALEGLVTREGTALLAWGLLAGLLIQHLTGRATPAALGFLVGPATGLMVLAGSLARAWWESRLFERARQGFVMRGEMGYALLRVHVVVVAILLGDGIAMVLGAVL